MNNYNGKMLVSQSREREIWGKRGGKDWKCVLMRKIINYNNRFEICRFQWKKESIFCADSKCYIRKDPGEVSWLAGAASHKTATSTAAIL